MEQRMKDRMTVVAAVVCVLLLVGCATAPVDLAAKGTVRVLVQNSEYAEVSGITVRQYPDDELLIRADVHPSKPERFFHPGHLRFVMADADGTTLLDFIITRYSREGHGHSDFKKKHASFWVRLPMTPREGSVLTVMHHEGPAGDDEIKAVAEPEPKERDSNEGNTFTK